MNSRSLLTALYRAAVDAVDPERLVSAALGRRAGALYVRSVSDPARREFVFVPDRVAVVALGKAAVPMAIGAHRLLGSRIDTGLVIAPAGGGRHGLGESFRLLETSHPHPDDRSLAAGEAALALASSLRSHDLLLVLLSGGGSSLAAAVPEGITLEGKVRTIALLGAAGASIAEINVVRGALSRLKAGRLGAAAGPASVVTLVLSDLGDDGWHLVAGGPTLGAPPVGREPLAILDRYRLVPLVPQAVRTFLASTPSPRAVSSARGNRWSVLLGDIRTALEGARLEAIRHGVEVRVSPELLAGEARVAATRLAVAAASAGHLRKLPHGRKPTVTIFGGETTVTVKGPGRGGRCRELALATALELRASGGSALVAGTDGVDHLPDAAGAFVDSETTARARARGLDPRAALAANDSGSFFEALGESFCPGPTGTNVGDVAFVLQPGDVREDRETAGPGPDPP